MNHNYSTNGSSSTSSSSSSNRDADSNVNLHHTHTAVLAENQAKEAEISQHVNGLKDRLQAKNTKNSYKNRKQKFLDWCTKEYRYEIEPGVFKGNRKRKRDDGETIPLGYESNQQYIKAIIDLYQDQVVSGENKHPHPWGQKLNTWRKEKMHSNRKTCCENYVDCGIGTLDDGYNYDEIVSVSLYFFDRATEAEMQNHASFLMHHMMMLCGESSRFAEFADLFRMSFPEDEIHSTSCPVFAFYTEFGKTLSNGNQSNFATIRYKDFRVCAFGAVAFYLFYRFHISNEKFPEFTKNQDWYGIKLLKGQNPKKEIAYSTMNDPIVRAFRACNITSLHTTHAGCGSGARDAELRGATEDQLRCHGCWNMQSMERHYLIKLSRSSIRAVNGFPTTDEFLEFASTLAHAVRTTSTPTELRL
ncbi:hypothetical protein INT45_001450 [Circinella minor]|uniref:Ndc10 domain-containing protein n=1 Tax=Circinella minor TaxID=1195481 RepID=A0A8H7RK14_9FUNG|nr:hypothetical protein INT45_001450 [Circinella minor]